MSDLVDALVYVSLPNNISDRTELYNIAKQTGIPNPSQISVPQAEQYLTKLLSSTTIKRACCTGRDGIGEGKGVNVRIPFPKGYTGGIDPVAKKFGYVDKTINVPSSMCTSGDYVGYTPGSTQCDEFYTAYCQNIKDFYIMENNGNFNSGEFASYKPDCACFGQQLNVPDVNVPPRCYMPDCTESNPYVYLDPSSRASKCTQNICIALIDYNKISGGGDVDINTTISQQCGGKPTPTPTSPPRPTPPTPTPTPCVDPPCPTPPPSGTRAFTYIILSIMILCLLSTSAGFIMKKKIIGVVASVITVLLFITFIVIRLR